MKIPLPPPSKAPAILIALALQASAIAPQAQPNQRSAGVTAETRVNTWLKTQDPNKDGRIAPDEATGLMKRFFERNDANSDGFLDKSELKALAGRLGRPRSNQPKANRNSQAQGGLSTEQMLKNAPKDVVIEPDIAYRPGDSKSWRLDLVRPRGQGGPLRPAIVFVHGGGWRNGDKRARTFLEGAIRYAQKGYVCVTVNYRLTGEAPFPACIEDVKCAVRWLRAHAEKYNLDPERHGRLRQFRRGAPRGDSRAGQTRRRTRRRRPLSGSVQPPAGRLRLRHADGFQSLPSSSRDRPEIRQRQIRRAQSSRRSARP